MTNIIIKSEGFGIIMIFVFFLRATAQFQQCLLGLFHEYTFFNVIVEKFCTLLISLPHVRTASNTFTITISQCICFFFDLGARKTVGE